MSALVRLIITAVRMLLKVDSVKTGNSHFGTQSLLANTAEQMGVNAMTQVQSSQRIAEMSASGTDWGEWPDSEAAFIISGSHLIALRGPMAQTGFMGPLCVSVGDDQLVLFDFSLYFGERQNTLAPVQQTVASFEMNNFRAPHFYLRPIVNTSSVRTEFLRCYQPVDSPLIGAFNLIAESTLPGPVSAFFDTEFAFKHLLPFLQQSQFTIEWTGDRLFVYNLQRTCAPQDLMHFAQATVQLGEMLRVNCQAYDAAQNERVAAVAKRLS